MDNCDNKIIVKTYFWNFEIFANIVISPEHNLSYMTILFFSCQTYVNLPANCRLSVDPNDACCKIATCAPTPAPNMTPNPMNTLVPNPGNTGGPTIAPNLKTTLVPNPYTGVPTLAPQPKSKSSLSNYSF